MRNDITSLYDTTRRKTKSKAFTEKTRFSGGKKSMYSEESKDFYTKAGNKIHYRIVRGAGDEPLVLIHGQCMCGQDYESVYEKLSTKYVLYLVDCFGHGDSEENEKLYRCNIIGDAITEFVQAEVTQACVISGHSSGGILAAYVAGKIPQLIKGLLLEDPPFFNVQPGEFENTFVYKDAFQVIHGFLNQTDEPEYIVYYIENGYIYNYLGQKFFGKDWAHNLAQEAKKKLKEKPNEIPALEKVSAKSFHGLVYMNKFDYRFSESFFTGEWFNGVNQEEILKRIQCPTVYLKAKTKYGKDGVLWAANSDESADRMMSLIKNGKRLKVKSGHDIHFEKPRHFLKAMKVLDKMIGK